jgi:uncharacterized phage-associated protein
VRFVFNERKAAQAAAFLLRLNRGSMPYLKLIKLLYLADREALVRTGLPITGDRYVSMDRGPVVSRIYALIYEPTAERDSPWFEYVTKPKNFAVSAVKNRNDIDELSPYETDLLESVFNGFGKLDPFALADLTHKICPEWRDPQGSSLPIEPVEIMKAQGATPEEIQHAERESMDLFLIDTARYGKDS